MVVAEDERTHVWPLCTFFPVICLEWGQKVFPCSQVNTLIVHKASRSIQLHAVRYFPRYLMGLFSDSQGGALISCGNPNLLSHVLHSITRHAPILRSAVGTCLEVDSICSWQFTEDNVAFIFSPLKQVQYAFFKMDCLHK